MPVASHLPARLTAFRKSAPCLSITQARPLDNAPATADEIRAIKAWLEIRAGMKPPATVKAFFVVSGGWTIFKRGREPRLYIRALYRKLG